MIWTGNRVENGGRQNQNAGTEDGLYYSTCVI